MGKFRQPPDRRQKSLFPASTEDYVSPDDDVRFVDALVDLFDLSAIEAKYSDLGRPAFAPRMLVKVLVYGRTRGIRSSRELARALRENIRFIFLANHEQPDFRTISLFRKQFSEELADLLKQTIRIGCQQGLINLERVAVDGTIVRANASARSFRPPADLEERLQALDTSFDEDVAIDEAEDDDYGDDDKDGRLPPSMQDPQQMRSKLKAALEEAKKPPLGTKPPKRVSTTDPESRFIKSKGTLPSYNAQGALDGESRLAVAAYATNATGDGAEVPRLLQEIEENTGLQIRQFYADRGYSGMKGLRELADRGIEAFIPQPKIRSDVFHESRFEYLPEEDAYRCPAGETLHYQGYDKRTQRRSYRCEDCEGCRFASECIGMSTRNRTLTVSEHSELKREMRDRMNGATARRAAGIRGALIETLFAHLKGSRKLSRFLLRGLERVTADWRFEVAVYNVERLMRLLSLEQIRQLSRA